MEPQSFYNNSIFWVEVDRIRPNPYQPRKNFDEARLLELAESIRQYGVLQPLVVTRHEEAREDGGLAVSYELIAGERRLRASKLAGLSQVPVIIRSGKENAKVKLELAIIENLQREDLNPIERAQAFARLVSEFNYKHTEIAKKIGRSRVYVSNTVRLLAMPEEMQGALAEGKISEGHTRPLLMLSGRPEEQSTLFKEVIYKKLTVRETEGIARRIAIERVRKKNELTPEMVEIEQKLTEVLGTRVHIKQGEMGGKIMIDYFSPDDLRGILELLHGSGGKGKDTALLDRFISSVEKLRGAREDDASAPAAANPGDIEEAGVAFEQGEAESPSGETRLEEEKEDDNLYSIRNFNI